MCFGEVDLGLFDQFVLVLAGDGFSAGAVQVRLHPFTMTQQPCWGDALGGPAVMRLGVGGSRSIVGRIRLG